MEGRGYRKIDIGELPEELAGAIDVFMYHINFESGTSEDCYRTEIDSCAKYAKRTGKITEEQYDALKEYYVHGGIYDSKGRPRDLEERLIAIPGSYPGFISAVLSYTEKKKSRYEDVVGFIDTHPDASASDILDFISGKDDFYEDAVPWEKTHAAEAILYKNQKPSPEQIEEIREAAKRPIVYDDDSPEMTPAAEKAFRLAAVSRSRVLP